MPKPKLDDATFIELFRKLGAAKLAQQIGIKERRVYTRRSLLQQKYGIDLNPPTKNITDPVYKPEVRHERIKIAIRNGTVLVGSDAHYWPGQPPSTAHRAFVKFCRDMKPMAVVMNGDVMDFPSISRHPPLGWESQPTPADEIEYAQDRLHEIAEACGKARKIWPAGNHDARFATRLASLAPEYAGVHGVHLKDHFPLWEPCWSVWFNEDVVVKHRFKGGLHASFNNAMWSGKNIVTGHLHKLQVSAFPDYNGTRWGIESGCMAEPYGSQFKDYTEDNPRLWQSGFVILTFVNGVLLQPELVRVFDHDAVDFRGKIHRIK